MLLRARPAPPRAAAGASGPPPQRARPVHARPPAPHRCPARRGLAVAAAGPFSGASQLWEAEGAGGGGFPDVSPLAAAAEVWSPGADADVPAPQPSAAGDDSQPAVRCLVLLIASPSLPPDSWLSHGAIT